MEFFGGIIAALRLVFDVLARRPRLTIRADTSERVAAMIGDSMIVNRLGLIRIHNGGPQRVTVNRAGWEAADGTRVEASGDFPATLEPGGPEEEASGDPGDLLRAHDAHGGLVTMYVELAGDPKPRRAKLPRDWIGRVRELLARDR